MCIGSIFVKNNLISAYMLMGGVAASRLGLWMFDLSVIQQMQVRGEPGGGGVVPDKRSAGPPSLSL